MTETITIDEFKYERARASFRYFLDFVKIQDTAPDDGETAGAEMDFILWPHLLFFVRVLELHRSIIVLKARQLGFSWIIAAFCLWMDLFHAGSNILKLSKNELEARKLLAKAKFIYERLPAPLKADIRGRVWGKESVEFVNDSSITALSSTEDAGRGETATVVVQDEADHHKYLEQNFGAVRPTVEDKQGYHIMLGTANQEDAESFFKQQFLKADALDEETAERINPTMNPFVRVFFPWSVRPDRPSDFRERLRTIYTDDVISKEYPESIEEALAPSRTACAFDVDALNEMREDCHDPRTDVKGLPAAGAVWRLYQPGRKYIAGSDTAHGVGGDYSVTVIIDAESRYVVADIFSNTLDPDDFAYQSVQLLDLYDHPIWGIENNEWGEVVIRAAQRLRYRPRYHRPVSRGASEAVGWHTDEPRRFILFADLQTAIRSRELTIPRLEGLKQFYDTIRNPKKNGRIEAIGGRHDDYPLAIGIAWQMVRYARRSGRSPGVAASEGSFRGRRVRESWALPGS